VVASEGNEEEQKIKGVGISSAAAALDGRDEVGRVDSDKMVVDDADDEVMEDEAVMEEKDEDDEEHQHAEAEELGQNDEAESEDDEDWMKDI